VKALEKRTRTRHADSKYSKVEGSDSTVHCPPASQPPQPWRRRYHARRIVSLRTAAALRDRIPTLEFILEHFDIVQGRVTTDGADVKPAVARKR
jgi:hypothetical protein